MNSPVPIAILIFKNKGEVSYRAYSPTVYDSTPDAHDVAFPQFMDRLYAHLGLNAADPLNNQTRFGTLLEIHTRKITVTLLARTQHVYFSTYEHPDCTYNPIHTKSPIYFTEAFANNYASIHTELVHIKASHEFV